MNTKADNKIINNELTFYYSSSSSLIVQAVNLELTKKYNRIIDCRLTFQVDFKLYQVIETKSLFNLNPLARISSTSIKFDPSSDVEIEASLKPDLLPKLQKHATSADEAANYLIELCHNPKLEKSQGFEKETLPKGSKSTNSLLLTENWLALSVKQLQESREVSYRTLWSHVNLFGLYIEDSSEEKVSSRITDLFQDFKNLSLDAVAQEITKEVTTDIDTESIATAANFLINFYEKYTETKPEQNPIGKPSKKTKPNPQDHSFKPHIFEVIVNFLKEEDWQFIQLKTASALRLAFEGKNGKFDCYAQAREQQKQFVFYSICPAKVPKPKRRAVGEFLSRANHGMIIGNFELNFDDGEVRYKTSIDVKNNLLSQDTIKQLVYTNVMMMDQYLPGITSVISGKMSPADAIAQIETQIN